MAACGSGGSSWDPLASDTDAGRTTSEVVGDNIVELSVSGNEDGLLLPEIGTDEKAVMAIYSSAVDSSKSAFELSTDEIGGVTNTAFLQTESFLAEDREAPEVFHERLRQWEEELSFEEVAVLPPAAKHYAITEGIGSERVFSVLKSFSGDAGYEDVAATLVYENEFVKAYVDSRDWDGSFQGDYTSVLDEFSRFIPQQRELLQQKESDVNGDGKFAVLFTRVVNGLAGQSGGGIITGFFFAQDLYEQVDSNRMEIIYSFVPDPDGKFGPGVSKSFAFGNVYPGVLPHEYQHMINFNTHVFLQRGPTERSFLNEGLSHLMEGIYSLNASGYMEDVGLENPGRVASYLNRISKVCFVCGANLSQRGGAVLFLRYLYEQAELGHLPGSADGADFLARLLETQKTGIENITAAAYGPHPSETDPFGALLGKFSLAVYLSNTGLDPGSEFEFSGIHLRGPQNDNRGTVLNGPAILQLTSFPFTQALEGNAITYMQVSGECVKELGDRLFLRMEEDGKFGGHLIRK